MKERALGFSFCGMTGHVPGASGVGTPEDLLLGLSRLWGRHRLPPPLSAVPCSAGRGASWGLHSPTWWA